MEGNNLGVRVVYRNKNLVPTYTKTYSLEDYVSMFSDDLRKLISDVEDLCYEANDGKERDEWSDKTFYAFNKIKHKLLDKAGDISRLPGNLIDMKLEPMANFVARLVNEGG